MIGVLFIAYSKKEKKSRGKGRTRRFFVGFLYFSRRFDQKNHLFSGKAGTCRVKSRKSTDLDMDFPALFWYNIIPNRV